MSRRPLIIVAIVVLAVRWRRRRPATWAEHVARRIERAGRKAGRPRRASETMSEYAAALEDLSTDETIRQLADDIEASAYGGYEATPDQQRRTLALARRLRV